MEPRRLDLILAVRRLPLGLFGYRRRDVERLADELQTEDQVEAQRWAEQISERTTAIALTHERLETLAGVLEEVERDCDRLSAQVEQARESAVLLESGAQVEVQRLKAQHADRMQQIRQMLPGIDEQITEADDHLKKLRDALTGILATDITTGDRPPGQEFADVAAAIFGSAHPPNSIIGSWVGGGRVRIQIDATRVRVQSRGGVPVGYLSGLVVEGFPPQVLGYELTAQGAVQGTIPAADVVAVQVNVVIVREGYHVLPADELTDTVESAQDVRKMPGRGEEDARAPTRTGVEGPLQSEGEPDGPALPKATMQRDRVRRPGAFRKFKAPSATRDTVGVKTTLSGGGLDAVPSGNPTALTPETIVKTEAQTDSMAKTEGALSPRRPETVDDFSAHGPHRAAATNREEELKSAPALPTDNRLERSPMTRDGTSEKAWEESNRESAEKYRLLADADQSAKASGAASEVEPLPELTPPETCTETVTPVENVATQAHLSSSSESNASDASDLDQGGTDDSLPVTASSFEAEQDWSHPAIHQRVPGADSTPWWEEDLPLPGVAHTPEPISTVASEASSHFAADPELDVLPGLSTPVTPLELPPPTWQAGDRQEMPSAPVARKPAASLSRPLPPRTPAESPSEPDALPASAVGLDVLAFLVGKIVGQDILDNQQQLIAAQGAVIDQALVERVEAAGRLPELIVYMTIPGLES